VDLATYSRESSSNRQAYQQMRDHIRRTYAGQYVALTLGKVIGAANSFDEARDLVHRLNPVPEYYLVFPAGMEPDFDLIYALSGNL